MASGVAGGVASGVAWGMALAALLLAGRPQRARALDLSQCIAPLGMEGGQIPDRDLLASSSFDDDNVGPQNGRLNQEIKGGAWCPRAPITTSASEWLEVQLRGVHVLTAAGTQGRFGNGQGREFAEAYALDYWRPRLAKWVRYRTHTGQEILSGNTNMYLEKKNQLEPPIWASRVRFVPYSAHTRTVCMRVELYGCPWTEGIVSYAMPRGDKRASGALLADAGYDGVWGAALRGGLGQLVDGRFGGDDIREGSQPPAWVGWRADPARPPPNITFEFDRVREFSAVHIHCNNRFMRDVQVFSEVIISFSVGGQQFQEDAIRFAPEPDGIFEHSRNVTVNLHHRIGRWVNVQMRFAARWILISEVVFDSDVAQGNYSIESLKPAGEGAGRAGAGAGAGLGAGGAGAGAGAGAGGGGGVPTLRRADPLYLAVVVGVGTALAILLGVGAALAVHRHRHRKCLASHSAHAATKPPPPPLPADKSLDDYQEPYQPLKCAPYFTYSTVLLEMKDFALGSNAALSDSSNYEYAVPEVSSEPLLPPPPPQQPPPQQPPPPPPSPPPSVRSHPSQRAHRKHSHHTPPREAPRRLAAAGVAEFPRHRLRMISKLAEGAFGTVYVAEADGVPEYDGAGAVTAGKRLVAVKFLCHDATASEREEFERDVSVLSRLSCPLLARVVGLCRSPPLAVVLEYLDTDLCAFLRACAARPPHAALARVATQLAAGCEYLESLHFVHRDLAARFFVEIEQTCTNIITNVDLEHYLIGDSTKNILIGKGYQIKISDFGTDNEAYAGDYYRGPLCAGAGAGGAGVGGAGVPLRWAAWESVLRGRWSTRSDAWAFAVTLHELYTLCRRRPHAALTDLQVLERLARVEAGVGGECGGAGVGGVGGGLERAPGVPRDLYDAMAACWRRDERERPSFHQLHAFLLQREQHLQDLGHGDQDIDYCDYE